MADVRAEVLQVARSVADRTAGKRVLAVDLLGASSGLRVGPGDRVVVTACSHGSYAPIPLPDATPPKEIDCSAVDRSSGTGAGVGDLLLKHSYLVIATAGNHILPVEVLGDKPGELDRDRVISSRDSANQQGNQIRVRVQEMVYNRRDITRQLLNVPNVYQSDDERNFHVQASFSIHVAQSGEKRNNCSVAGSDSP
jgi:hypothetical protein